MSAIQASILSPTNNERRVAAVRPSSSVSSASASLERGGRGRGREMLPEVAAASVNNGGGCSTQLRRNSIDSSLSKVIIISSTILFLLVSQSHTLGSVGCGPWIRDRATQPDSRIYFDANGQRTRDGQRVEMIMDLGNVLSEIPCKNRKPRFLFASRSQRKKQIM